MAAIFVQFPANFRFSGALDTKIKNSLPCAKNFFLSLMDDIFVTCNLKVIKNNRNTYHNMHFDKKLPKKVLSTYVRLYPPGLPAQTEEH